MTQKPTNFPDFFVVGAQKAGTTSLCAALEHISGIAFSRPKEPMVLSRDDIELHPHFFAEQPEAWARCDWMRDPATMLSAYGNCFAHAKTGDLLGDGSTSYLGSADVPARIAQTNPHAKIIAIFRDPTRRAYSAYWHYVKTGIACETFASHLRFEQGLTLRSGHYADFVTHWLRYFPRSRCHFILYEQMLRDPAAAVRDTCQFLGITPPAKPILPVENQAKTPRFLWIQLMQNLLCRKLGLPMSAIEDASSKHPLQRLLRAMLEWNLCDDPYPPMDAAMQQRLDRYYARVNERFTALTGLDTSGHWYHTIR